MPKEKFGVSDQGTAISIRWDRTTKLVALSVDLMLPEGCVMVTPEAFEAGGPLALAGIDKKLVLNGDGSVPVDDVTTFVSVTDEVEVDRDWINNQIRLLRRVRDAVFGRDE